MLLSSLSSAALLSSLLLKIIHTCLMINVCQYVFSSTMLSRVLLLVLLPISQVWSSRGPPDIAFGKPTSQSSTASGHVSSGPVSGHNASSCSQTRKEGGCWWKVDLGDYFSITDVALTSKRGTPSKLKEYVGISCKICSVLVIGQWLHHFVLCRPSS